jgi:serine/threonine protein kinase
LQECFNAIFKLHHQAASDTNDDNFQYAQGKLKDLRREKRYHENCLNIIYYNLFNVVFGKDSKGKSPVDITEKIKDMDFLSDIDAFGEADKETLSNLQYTFKEMDIKTEELTIDTTTKPLGMGGLGTVFKGEYIKNPVAVKRLPFENDVDNIIEKYDVIRRLNHPYIIYIYGFNKNDTDKKVDLVMQLVDWNLEDYIKNKEFDRISFKEKCKIASQIAQGMKYLHDCNIAHLDLKPSNILVTTCLNVKITDFDFARIGLNEESAFVERSTPQYSPPEFLLYNKCYYQSDIFAFGLVLYFLFTEDDFFGAEYSGVGSDETIDNVKKYYTQYKTNNLALDFEKVKIAFKHFHTYTELIEVLDKCFQENPRSRYSSFDDIIQYEDRNAKKNKVPQDKDSGPKLVKRFEAIGRQETNKFEKEVKDAFENIWSKSGGGSQADTEAPFNKFIEQFCTYFNDPNVLERKPEGDKISDEEIIRKYLFLSLTNKSNLNDYKDDQPNNNSEVNKEKFEKFMSLYGKGLLEYKNDKKDGKNCIQKMYKDLWSQNWYWEDTSREITRNALSALHSPHGITSKKDKKKEPKRSNYFLVRNGFEKQNTFTLEILLFSFDFIQKISIEDYSTMLKIVKNLKSNKNKFDECERNSTKIEKIQTSDLEKRKKERKKKEKEKKREEERERENKRREKNGPPQKKS